MNSCHVCNDSCDSEMNPCNACFDHVVSRLENLKMYLKPEMMNQILQIGFHICERKLNHNPCQLCELATDFNKKYSEIKKICNKCGDEIMKRTILLYDSKESMLQNIERGYRCYLYKLSI